MILAMKYPLLYGFILCLICVISLPGCDNPPPAIPLVVSETLPARYVNALQDLAAPTPMTLRQVTLSNPGERRTMTAVNGEVLPHWAFNVPENGALLRFNVGILLTELRKNDLKTTFRIVSETHSPPQQLWSETITLPSGESSIFQPREIDLSAYKGAPLELSFSSTNQTLIPPSALHWWGNPILLPKKNPTPPKTPVILISCDTLRADHVGCYGHRRPTTPNIDRFAQDAVRFSRAYSNESWTLTAHMSMFTGLTPNHHRLSPYLNLPDNIPTLTECLQDAGYTAAGFTGHRSWLMPSRGFGRGFDLYVTPIGAYRNIDAVMNEFYTDWFPKHKQESLFLFLHNYDIHDKHESTNTPYDPEDDDFRIFTHGLSVPPFHYPELPEVKGGNLLQAHNDKKICFSLEEQQYIDLTYDECVYKVDHALGELFRYLKDAPFPNTTNGSYYDHALIIVTSDHGESLGEHDKYRHGSLFEDNVHIPLLIKFPGGKFSGRVNNELVDLTDLMPTVLDTLGQEIPPDLDGISLLSLLRNETPPRSDLFFQRLRHRAIRNDHIKLLHNIQSNHFELYNLLQDPKELKNCYTPEDSNAAPMQTKLNTYFQPPQDGWVIHLQDPEGTLETTLTITADQPISNTHIQEGFFIEKFGLGEKGRKTFTGYAQITPEHPEFTLRIQTEPAASTITLQVLSSKPLSLIHQPEQPLQQELDFTLDAATARNTPAAHNALTALKAPALHVYYVPPAAKGEEAAPLSEQALEELEALGYLEELK